MSEIVQQVKNTLEAIVLTDAAKRHLIAYLDKEPVAGGVRFSVKKTGCSGLSYVVDYVEAAQNNDIVMPLNEAYQLFIDKASYPFLKGMRIDYVQQGLNHKFVFNNPNQTGQCGCGESFTVDSE